MAKKRHTKTHKLMTQIAEYIVAGGAWFWSGYVIIVFLDDKIPLFWANFIGNLVGLSINFLLERYWVFRTKSAASLTTATWRYVAYTAFNAFLLNYLILQVLKNIGIDPAIGQFVAAAFFTVWNFFWYRAWVFKGAEKPKRTRHHA